LYHIPPITARKHRAGCCARLPAPLRYPDDFRWGFMFGFGSGLDVSRGGIKLLEEENKNLDKIIYEK
jgi:hypothetical protein